MAINYTNLFTRIGKCIQAANYYATVFATMKTNGQEYVQAIADQNLDALADGTANAVSSHISGLSAGCAYWQNKVTEILVDPSLTNELAITNTSLQSVLAALYLQMVDDQEYVLESFLAVGTPNKTTNSGTAGELVGIAVLDSVSSAGNNAPVMPYYDLASDVRSEVGIADTLYCRCTNADVEGEETFTLFGNNTTAAFQEDSESAGGSTTVQVTAQANLLSNGDLETYSGGFTGWTIDDASGTLSQETSLMYRGASAAKILTLGTSDTVTFTQELATPLIPGKGYIVGCRIRSVVAEASGAVSFGVTASDGTLTAQSFGGDNSAALNTTSWQYLYRYVQYPRLADPNEDSTLVYTFVSSVNDVDGLIFDDFFCVPAVFFNGAAWAVITGSGRFRLNDLFDVALTRSSPAVIQEFIRKTYGVQLPSAESGSETIADSLAT